LGGPYRSMVPSTTAITTTAPLPISDRVPTAPLLPVVVVVVAEIVVVVVVVVG
jgi:hypothetical protein